MPFNKFDRVRGRPHLKKKCNFSPCWLALLRLWGLEWLPPLVLLDWLILLVRKWLFLIPPWIPPELAAEIALVYNMYFFLISVGGMFRWSLHHLSLRNDFEYSERFVSTFEFLNLHKCNLCFSRRTWCSQYTGCLRSFLCLCYGHHFRFRLETSQLRLHFDCWIRWQCQCYESKYRCFLGRRFVANQ